MALPSQVKFGLHCEYGGRRIPKKDFVAGPDDQTLICVDVRSCREPSISTRRATQVGGVKSCVCGVFEGVGPAVRMLTSWRLGAGEVAEVCKEGGRREKQRARCVGGGGASSPNAAIVASGGRWSGPGVQRTWTV